jgi:CheY-like chemotaxis protein
MVVEDEFLLALCLTEALEQAGASVLGPVASIEGALALIEREPQIDAALLDMNLGGEAIYPVADRLMDARVPFIFTTGYDHSLTPARYQDIQHCNKPYRLDDVMTWLGKAAEKER